MRAIDLRNKVGIYPPGAFRARRFRARESASAAILSALFILLLTSLACGPSSSTGEQGPGSSDVPELTDEVINERINDAFVRNVSEENGTGEPIGWSFDEDEPKEVAVVEKNIERDRATLVLDIKTTSSPRASNKRYLAGQIRTEWRLQTGWVLRRWEIVETENISMKYRNLPKGPAQNTNQ